MLCLQMYGNHRCLRWQWYDERRNSSAEWNETTVFTDESHYCAIPWWPDKSLETSWLGIAELLFYACRISSEPYIMIWVGFGYHCRTLSHALPVLWLTNAISLKCWDPLSSRIFRTCQLSHSNRIMRDNTWHTMFKTSFLPFRFHCCLASLFSWSITYQKHLADGCRTAGLGYIALCYTKSSMTICGSSMNYYTTRTYLKSL